MEHTPPEKVAEIFSRDAIPVELIKEGVLGSQIGRRGPWIPFIANSAS